MKGDKGLHKIAAEQYRNRPSPSAFVRHVQTRNYPMTTIKQILLGLVLAAGMFAPGQVLADRPPSPEERSSIEAMLRNEGFTRWGKIGLEDDDDLWEIDDAYASDGRKYDLQLERDTLEIVAREPDERALKRNRKRWFRSWLLAELRPGHHGWSGSASTRMLTVSLCSQRCSASRASASMARSRAASKALARVGARRISRSPRTELASVVMYLAMVVPQNGGTSSSRARPAVATFLGSAMLNTLGTVP